MGVSSCVTRWVRRCRRRARGLRPRENGRGRRLKRSMKLCWALVAGRIR